MAKCLNVILEIHQFKLIYSIFFPLVWKLVVISEVYDEGVIIILGDTIDDVSQFFSPLPCPPHMVNMVNNDILSIKTQEVIIAIFFKHCISHTSLMKLDHKMKCKIPYSSYNFKYSL